MSSFSRDKLRFQNVFRPHKNTKLPFSNSTGLKNVFEKFRFRDRFVWTVGVTIEIKPCFQIPPVVWTLSKYDILLVRETKHGQNHWISIAHNANSNKKRKNRTHLGYSRTGLPYSVDLLEFFLFDFPCEGFLKRAVVEWTSLSESSKELFVNRYF